MEREQEAPLYALVVWRDSMETGNLPIDAALVEVAKGRAILFARECVDCMPRLKALEAIEPVQSNPRRLEDHGEQ